MAIADILSALITKEGTLTGNPVAPFAYSSTAFARDDADGHPDYNVARENNIPTADPDVLDVNGTVLAKGFRSQASSLTRMLMNHFFGRASYNLNKTVEVMNSLLAGLSSALGANNGIATLDSSGKLSSSQIPGEIVTSVNGVSASNNTVDITGEDINVSSSGSTKVNTALATLQSNIEAEATARRSTDTALQSDIDDLETADQTLQTNIDTISANLASEVSARESDVSDLYDRLNSGGGAGTITNTTVSSSQTNQKCECVFTNSKGFANKTTLFSIVNDLGEISSGVVTPSLQCGMSAPPSSSVSCALSNSNKTLTVSFTIVRGQGATLTTSCSGGYISVNA